MARVRSCAGSRWSHWIIWTTSKQGLFTCKGHWGRLGKEETSAHPGQGRGGCGAAQNDHQAPNNRQGLGWNSNRIWESLMTQPKTLQQTSPRPFHPQGGLQPHQWAELGRGRQPPRQREDNAPPGSDAEIPSSASITRH